MEATPAAPRKRRIQTVDNSTAEFEAPAKAPTPTEPVDDGRRCALMPTKNGKGCTKDFGHEKTDPIHGNGERTWLDNLNAKAPKKTGKALVWSRHPDGDHFTNGRKVPYRIAQEGPGIFRIYVHGVADVAAPSSDMARVHCQEIEDGIIPTVPQASGAAVADPPAPRLPAATAPAPIGPVVTLLIPLEQLVEDPDNVRKEYDLASLDAIGANMILQGQLQPIGVRPFRVAGQVMPERWMVKWGHRRLRAALRTKGKITHLRAEVLDATDDQVPGQQLSENDQREPLRALERSNAHHAMAQRGKTDKQIAEEAGCSEATVRDHLRLQRLAPQVKKAWVDGALDSEPGKRDGYSKALEFAKFPAVVQVPFLKDVLEGTDDGEPLSVRQVRALGIRYYMLDLAHAKFPRADAQLVPKAGACTNCEKRTGAQADLLEQSKLDLCMDKPCHASKNTAFLAQSEKAGRRVLNEGTAKQIFNEYSHGDRPQYNSTYVLADEKAPGSKKTYAQLVDKKDVALVVNPSTGSMLEVVSKSALPTPKREEVPKLKKDPERVKMERAHDIRVEAAKAARLQLLEKVKKAGTDTHWLRVAIAGMLGSARSDPLKDLCKWRGIEADNTERVEALNELASTLVAGELRALLFDLALAERISPCFNGGDHTALLKGACKDLDVDLGQLGKDAKAALDVEEKAKASKQRAADNHRASKAEAKTEIKWKLVAPTRTFGRRPSDKNGYSIRKETPHCFRVELMDQIGTTKGTKGPFESLELAQEWCEKQPVNPADKKSKAAA